jgi:hypothetical protein
MRSTADFLRFSDTANISPIRIPPIGENVGMGFDNTEQFVGGVRDEDIAFPKGTSRRRPRMQRRRKKGKPHTPEGCGVRRETEITTTRV